jgi:hypothetical protein
LIDHSNNSSLSGKGSRESNFAGKQGGDVSVHAIGKISFL